MDRIVGLDRSDGSDKEQPHTPTPPPFSQKTNKKQAKKMYTKEYTLFTLGVLPCVLLPLLVWLALAATNERRYGRKGGLGGKKRR